jgi:hypothetical protein
MENAAAEDDSMRGLSVNVQRAKQLAENLGDVYQRVKQTATGRKVGEDIACHVHALTHDMLPSRSA